MPSFIDIYFRFPNLEFRIPVIPAEITINDGSEWYRVPVQGLGEVALPAFRKPQEISFSSFFPYQYDPGYCQYSDLLHPADAWDLFNVAMGHEDVRPQIVRVLIVEEYESGVWTTWIDEEFAIESFQRAHRAGNLVDIYYQITIRSVKTATLRATGALADNIGTQKPHPVRTGTEDPNHDVTTGDTGNRITRPVVSPTNLQLAGGVDPRNVSKSLTGFDPSKNLIGVDTTQPIGGSKYSTDLTNPDALKWGSDSSAKVTMTPWNGQEQLGDYITQFDYVPQQITRDEYVNNGGIIRSGKPQ